MLVPHKVIIPGQIANLRDQDTNLFFNQLKNWLITAYPDYELIAVEGKIAHCQPKKLTLL
ncbi:hypothetical protein SAMN05421676_102330 [Salinibacillus kushneri]|uniref:Uncharacterized protein n=1 Tax=Salinibacillus kushneri TaxID=237682 RepID=A0A1I0B261_9BACI|nr:hypothetical protein [Salinibacillus kushneri]SET00832.1 hypothetical protein SAMN05421676_102330 [Salinibacillus kushneri]